MEEQFKENLPSSANVSRRDKLAMWREQKQQKGGGGIPAQKKPPVPRQSVASTKARAPSVTNDTAAASSAKKTVRAKSTAEAQPASAKLVKKSIPASSTSTSIRPCDPAPPKAQGAAPSRAELLQRYREDKERIKELKAGPKQRSSSEHRVVKSVDKTSVKSVPKSTDSLLKKLFDKRVEKMIEFSEAGEIEYAEQLRQSLMEERFNRFRTSSRYWIALSRVAVAKGDYSEAIRLLSQGSKCASRPSDSVRLSSALGTLVVLAGRAMADDSNSPEQTPTTPAPNLKEELFYFNELAPESAEFLMDCMEKEKTLPAEDDTSERRPRPGEPTPIRDQLHVAIQAVQNSPLFKTPGSAARLARASGPRSVPSSPYVAAASTEVPSMSSGDEELSCESDLPLPDFSFDPSPPTPSALVLPSSPTPPELSESSRHLTAPSCRKMLYPKSPCAPSLTPTTRQILGEIKSDASGSSSTLKRPARMSLPTVQSSVPMVQRGAATAQRPLHKTPQAGSELIRRAVYNRSAQLAAVAEATHTSESTTSIQELTVNADRASTSSDDSEEALTSGFSLLNLSSAEVSLSEGDSDGLSQEEKDQPSTTVEEDDNDNNLGQAKRARKPRYSSIVPQGAAVTPGYGRFDTFAPTRRTSSMRNADPYDVSCGASPIAPVISQGLLSPAVAALTATPFQAHVKEEATQTTQTTDEVLITPVRRSMRLNPKTTTPLAMVHTPHPFGKAMRFPPKPVEQTETTATPKAEDDAEKLETKQTDEEESEKMEVEGTKPAPEVPAATEEACTPRPAERNPRINFKQDTPAAKMATPFPFARRAAVPASQRIVVLPNPHLANITDN